jgi:hypothetical protein
MTFLSSSHDACFAWGKRLPVPHYGMVKPPAHYGELGDAPNIMGKGKTIP